MLTKDKGICIRTTDYSDNSQILTFFTSQTGKVSLIAKGAKKTKSSFGGPIQLCAIGDMVFSLKDDDKLGTLTEFNSTFFAVSLRKKLLALNCSLLAVDLLNLFTKEHDAHPAIFTDTVSFMERLEECQNDKSLHWMAIFEFSLLRQTGSLPVCNHCSNCKRMLTADWKDFYFSSSANGLLCRDCEGVFSDRKVVTYTCAKYLAAPDEIAPDNTTLVLAQKLLIEYITHILGRIPKTAAMILMLIK